MAEMSDLQFSELGARIEQRRLDRRAAELRLAGSRRAARLREVATMAALEMVGKDLASLADDLDGWSPDEPAAGEEYARYLAERHYDPRD